LAKFTAILRASSFVSNFAADRRPGFVKYHDGLSDCVNALGLSTPELLPPLSFTTKAASSSSIVVAGSGDFLTCFDSDQ